MTGTDTPAYQARVLASLLGLSSPPVAITFSSETPTGVPHYDDPMPLPASDGRTGRVSAGCVFWIKARDKSFTTAAEDHGNCSVGSLTHGLKTLEQAAEGGDVVALIESEWVSPDVFPEIPTVRGNPNFVTYGPLATVQSDPDVVLDRKSVV